jgi:cell division septum initiation protein DivIVA
MTVDQQFNIVNDKLQQMLRQYSRLQKENEKLKQELEEAKDREQQTKQKVENLQMQVSILQVASGEMNDKDKKAFEKKINQYIREIDKCIAYLSQ